MNFKVCLIFISLLCLLECSIVVNAANYQSIQSNCQNNKAGCVVLSFLRGYNKADQAVLSSGDQIECANDGSAGQICSYKDSGGAQISCAGSDSIDVRNIGNKMIPTYNGDSKQHFSTSGDRTNIFVAQCLTKP